MLFDRLTNGAPTPVLSCSEFGGPGAELCRFAACGGRRAGRVLQRGERLTTREQACMRFYVIRRGLVAACAMTPDGRRQILCLNAPGDPVCPMSVEGSDCWCEALTETEVCELNFAGDSARLRADPAFVMFLFRLVHERLERSAAHVVTLGRFDGMERVCGFFVEMTHRIGRPHGTAWRLTLPMSRDDIADYLGLNADTVSRLLTRIKRAGLARFPSRVDYEIPSLERLEARIPVTLGRSLERNVRTSRRLAS